MSVKYFASSNQPVNKSFQGDAGSTTFTVWTPASGKSIVCTDILVSGAFAGTVRFLLGTDFTAADTTITRLFEVNLASSANVKLAFDSPIIGTANQTLGAVAHTGGRISVFMSGFEQD